MATFYIEAVENTQIALVMVGSPTIGTVKYGVNDSTCPNTYTVTTESTPISLTAGQKCYWTITSTTTAFSSSNYLKFTSTAKINVGGNMSDLIGGETQVPRNFCFYGLFYNCTNLVSASNLVLVNNINSKTSCYNTMFRGCASLSVAPELPATTLAVSCYRGMFQDCTSLTTAPALPATTLGNASSCYYSMFQGCTSLTTPPELPATTLVISCYSTMFRDCTSLTTAPELPATTLKNYCYEYMFQGCTSLTTPPELPATTLANYCYQYMFSSCMSLTIAPELPATTLVSYCYNFMFQDCTSLTTAPALPATTLNDYCYRAMFRGCASLTTVPELPATTLASNCYYYMFYDCSSIKLSETQTAPYSIPYRIPNEGTGTEGTGSLDNMFYNTGGTFTGTPTINKTYYLAPPSSPIFITYKGQELANFESGSKTLKCGGKYMEGDVIIAREIGANDVVVLYDSNAILTFQNGTKTLKCAGKCMATDVTIEVV